MFNCVESRRPLGDTHVFNSKAQLDLGDVHWRRFGDFHETDVQRQKRNQGFVGVCGNI